MLLESASIKDSAVEAVVYSKLVLGVFEHMAESFVSVQILLPTVEVIDKADYCTVQ